MYKSAEPYWPYVNTAMYLGRFALGANPLALGAGGLSAISAAAVRRHRPASDQPAGAGAASASWSGVIGYEVAGIYGGNFRHRDANWIYAAELTELVSEFPLSRDSLAHALREIGALELRSEYDRIFLYRCLANGKSAGPEPYTGRDRADDGRAAGRGHAAGAVSGSVRSRQIGRAHWPLEDSRGGAAGHQAVGRAENFVGQRARSNRRCGPLAGQLSGGRQAARSARGRRSWLAKSAASCEELPIEERYRLLTAASASASFFFEHPDLDPDGDLADKYLDDLAALNARTAAAGRGH